MARSIDIIDKYQIRFHKNWSEMELFAINCLGFMLDDNDMSVMVDTRATMPDSLKLFLKNSFSTIMFAPSNEAFRNDLFNRLNQMYKRNFKEFKEQYLSRLEYPLNLHKYKQKDLSVMIHRKYNLLSYEQGLGKTITSASISKCLKIKRTVIICPSLPKWNWYLNMTNDWGYNSMYWSILDAKKSKSIKAFRERFVVTNYEQVKKNMPYFDSEPIGHIILDECQQIKNPSAQRSKAISSLIKSQPNARLTFLSGTPMSNRVDDLFGYLKPIKHPLGRNKAHFIRRYAITAGRGNKIIGAKNMDELNYFISNFMIRRTADDELDLPDMNMIKYYFESEELGSEYDEIMEEMYQNSIEYDRAQGNEKRQIGVKIRGNIHSLNRITATAKAPSIAKLIDGIIAEGRKVVVFAGYKNALSALEDIYGEACVKIDGSVDSHKRQVYIDRFKKDPNCHVFLGNMKAAGVGINLVNARDTIFMNFPFTPDDIAQAQKRLHRIGQTQKVNVYYTIAKDSIDERIFSMIDEKNRDINAIIDKGKGGSIEYGNLQNKLWKELLFEYEQKRTGIKKSKKQKGFVSVK